ncbi:MAG: hypothetical protein LBT03_00070 [Holosporales bacterium]|jgi:hypothetical protein|nr:hypothetical protein [Holosporales bacterium]
MSFKLIKRGVAKFGIAVFVCSNVTQVFCMQGAPEFVVNIEKNQEAGDAAFKVQVQRKQDASTTTIENYVTSATMMKPQMAAMASLCEASQRAKSTIATGTFALPDVTAEAKCFCMNIPELGELFISQDGDAVFSNRNATGKSIKIITPRQLVLNDITGDIEVEADFAVLTGKTKASLNSLSFRRKINQGSFGGLFIDKESELEVGTLFIEDALLLNTGRLTVNCMTSMNHLDNSGIATFNSQLIGLRSIHNREGAQLFLLDKTVVAPGAIEVGIQDEGAFVVDEGTQLFLLDGTVGAPDNIGIRNDGNIFVRRKAGVGIDPTKPDFEIHGTYKASSGASLRAEGGVRVFAHGFQNDGIVQTEGKLRFVQIGATAAGTKFGRVIAGVSVEYETTGDAANLDGEFITPIVTGEDKAFKVKSSRGIIISRPAKMNVDLNIEAPRVGIKSELKVRNLAVKAGLFTVAATGNVGSKRNVFIEANRFENISGKIHALGDIALNVTGMFVNTGGKATNQKTITIPCYKKTKVSTNKTFVVEHLGRRTKTYDKYPITNEKGELACVNSVLYDVSTEVEEYFLSTEMAGQIACHRNLSIKANIIDNSYGYLHSRESISATAGTTVLNQVGLVYALQEIHIRGSHFSNCLVLEHSRHIADAVDPTKPVVTKKSFPTSFCLDRHSHLFHGATYSVGNWCGYRDFDVVTDYLPYRDGQVPLFLKLPGYLCAAGDVSVDAEFDVDLGMIVSEREVVVRGKKQARTTNLVSCGNIAEEFQKAEVQRMRIEAQNALFDELDDFVID